MKKEYDLSIIENYLKDEINSNRISGASITIYKDGEFLLDECLGYANIEKEYKITPNTRFRLASMTKPITGVAAMIAVELGLFNLNDYAYKYISEVKDMPIIDKDFNIIDKGPYNFTILELLNHSAGFAGFDFESILYKKCVKDENLHELKDFIKDVPKMALAFEPGKYFAYSGSFAYDIVARIIEVTSGLKYEDFLKKYIFDPLEMVDTSYHYNDGDEINKAISYESIDGKLVYHDDLNRGYELYYPGYNSGGAGLISTKKDYFNFALMLLNKGVFKGRRIIKEESLNKMLEYTPTPNFITHGIETFGVSFFVRTKEYSNWQKLVSGCYGWSGAYGTHFFIDPTNNLILIYMHNSSTFGGSGARQHVELESEICDIFNLKRE